MPAFCWSAVCDWRLFLFLQEFVLCVACGRMMLFPHSNWYQITSRPSSSKSKLHFERKALSSLVTDHYCYWFFHFCHTAIKSMPLCLIWNGLFISGLFSYILYPFRVVFVNFHIQVFILVLVYELILKLLHNSRPVPGKCSSYSYYYLICICEI